MSPPAADTSTKSGIITSDTGERHIPSSTRPDGTQRKEIKIRPGYKPPEDVEVYKNRTAEAWKTRGATGCVPGAAAAADDDDDKAGAGDGRASSNKNAKRREARRKAKGVDEGKEKETSNAEGKGKGDGNGAGEKAGSVAGALAKQNWRAFSKGEEVAELDPEAEREKQARTLRKKLRQARELREKREKGENLLPEQFEKVIRINELIRQLDSLGFDQEGEKKAEV